MTTDSWNWQHDNRFMMMSLLRHLGTGQQIHDDVLTEALGNCNVTTDSWHDVLTEALGNCNVTTDS